VGKAGQAREGLTQPPFGPRREDLLVTASYDEKKEADNHILLCVALVTNIYSTTKQKSGSSVRRRSSIAHLSKNTVAYLATSDQQTHHLTPATAARDPRQLAFLTEKAFGPITQTRIERMRCLVASIPAY
jgi:hypothetical protein